MNIVTDRSMTSSADVAYSYAHVVGAEWGPCKGAVSLYGRQSV